MDNSIILEAEGISLRFHETCGMLSDLTVTEGGKRIAPLHHAPWLGQNLPPDAPRHQAHLQGDFLAAPFGPGPDGLHGPAANGDWRVMHHEGALLRALLQGPIMGASVIKELSLEAGQPFLYQRHIFLGGNGRLPLANHAMVSLPEGGKLSFSRKRWFETLETPLESDPARGRSALAYPRRAEDAAEFPAADGGTVNLHKYPWGAAHEDFVSAIEEPSSPLGWTAVVRPAEGDMVLSLRNPKQLPMTMLWHSNGGRDYAPWNGGNRGCLGIEEGAALPVLGLSAHEEPNPLAAAGQPDLVTLAPQGSVDIRHILGAFDWPSGQAVAGVQLEGDMLTVTGDWGAERRLPIRGGWLGLAAEKSSPAPSKVDWDF